MSTIEIACLKIASLPPASLVRDCLWDERAKEFGEAELVKTMEQLYAQGRVEIGVSAKQAWLTEQGNDLIRELEL